MPRVNKFFDMFKRKGEFPGQGPPHLRRALAGICRGRYALRGQRVAVQIPCWGRSGTLRWEFHIYWKELEMLGREFHVFLYALPEGYPRERGVQIREPVHIRSLEMMAHVIIISVSLLTCLVALACLVAALIGRLL